MNPKLDVLVVAAHPDDAEISVGGTILRLIDRGKRVGVVDLSRGELGTRGSPEQRAREVERANALMRAAWRHNMELPDGRIAPTLEARERLASLLRDTRPDVVLAHYFEDLHPDHRAAGELARAAWYLAGLRTLATTAGGAGAHRPSRIYHFLGHVHVTPSVVVDVSAVWSRKLELIRCYESQLVPQGAEDRGQHLLFGADILARAETKARYFGERIGVRFGEPLVHVGPLPCFDPLL